MQHHTNHIATKGNGINLNGISHKVQKREVRFGSGALDKPMSLKEAKNWGDRHMPQDLKAAGFKTVIFESDPDLHGGLWYRVNFGKSISIH